MRLKELLQTWPANNKEDYKMEKNKSFEKPELIIVVFDENDIIATSGENYDPYDSNKDYWQD